MNDIGVVDTNTWYDGLVTGLKKIIGSLVTN